MSQREFKTEKLTSRWEASAGLPMGEAELVCIGVAWQMSTHEHTQQRTSIFVRKQHERRAENTGGKQTGSSACVDDEACVCGTQH